MMRSIPLDRYRTIGILASQDAGRTTTTERILALAGRQDRAANDGAARSWQDLANDRAITLTTAATGCLWRGCRINIVDLSVDGALDVLDAAVVVVDGTCGITAEAKEMLARIEARGLARLVFVNKLDRDGADFLAVLHGLDGDATPVVLQMPIGAGLDGLVDVVEQIATRWPRASFGAPGEEGPVPAELGETRARLLAAVGSDDEGGLKARIRAAVLARTILPVLAGSAFLDRGIGPLLDAIVDYLPAPSDLALRAVAADGSAVERRGSDEEPFAGLAFQTVDDPASGKLTFVRIYSGVVARGSVMLNSVSTSPETIGEMVRMHANHAETVEEAHSGDIVALAGLANTTTGDTLCDPAAPVILERVPATAGRAKH